MTTGKHKENDESDENPQNKENSLSKQIPADLISKPNLLIQTHIEEGTGMTGYKDAEIYQEEGNKELEMEGLTEIVGTSDDINMDSMENNQTNGDNADNLSELSEPNLLKLTTDEDRIFSTREEAVETEIETTDYINSNIEKVAQTNFKRKCDDCDMEFSSDGSLLNHKRYKHEGIMYSCDLCNYKAGQAGNLKRHLSYHH